ncbi:hypothetical protein OEZ86_001239 [Tetradesmus obliquus]|nr:hypothetical protein OEZ86_001239 [Tetradesmus obliquus]
MWGWLRGLWASKGSGGCISADGRGPATLTPLESKLSSRSCKGVNQDGDSGAGTPQQNCQRKQQHQQQQQQKQLDPCVSQPDSNGASDQLESSADAELPPSAGRYIIAGGKPVGIANTVRRYHESRPLVPHLTPFEARLEAKITAEDQVAAAVLQAGAGAAAGSTRKQLFDGQ